MATARIKMATDLWLTTLVRRHLLIGIMQEYQSASKYKKMDDTNIAAEDNNGIVNGSHSLLNNFNIKFEGKELYSCNNVNIKNLLEYSPHYAGTAATNEFFYIDTNRYAEERSAEDNYNKGFAARKAILGTSVVVNTEMTLNRYSFFEALDDKLLPDMKL